MHFWYYADSDNQQQGPVDASLLRARAERGELPPSTLVWREGMAGWVPLAQVAGELGVTLAGAPPALPARGPGAAAGPVRIVQPAGGSNAWVIVVVLLVVVVGVLGILAAIAIPAYSDYTVRSRVMQAYAEATLIKLTVTEARLSEENCPANGSDGIGTPESYADEDISAIHVGGSVADGCTIRLVLNQLGAGVPAGSEIVLTLDADSNWQTSTTIEKRYLPASLR